jgi:hypothetical protein
MNEAIELHDSELIAVSSMGDSIELSFCPAYIHRSEGRPGIDVGTGWIQGVTLTIRGASGFSPVALPATVSTGWLRIGGDLHRNVIPTTGAFEGPIEFSAVVFAKEFTIKGDIMIRGTHLSIALQGEPSYVEDFVPKPSVD